MRAREFIVENQDQAAVDALLKKHGWSVGKTSNGDPAFTWQGSTYVFYGERMRITLPNGKSVSVVWGKRPDWQGRPGDISFAQALQNKYITFDLPIWQALDRGQINDAQALQQFKAENERQAREAVAQGVNKSSGSITELKVSTKTVADPQAAGCILYAEDTGRWGLQQRSDTVNDPGVWAAWGGGREPGESLEQCVRRELAEESGYRGPIKLEPLAQNAKYVTFIGVVPREFEPRPCDEWKDYCWVELGRWPTPLHPGVAAALDNVYIKEGITEGSLGEAVGGNYLYHATSADGLKGMLSSGSIRSATGPQAATLAQTKLPTVSVTRDWGYASGSQAQSQLGGIGRDAIIVLDRNAVESNFKTLGTSQSTNIKGLAFNPYLKKDGEARSQNTDPMARTNAKAKAKYAEPTAKAGGEFEEAVIVPKGALPLKGTMTGFWVNPKSELMKDPTIINDPRRLDMIRPNQFVKATQQQGVAEDKDYMAGHCHVMAVALKQLHPDWQIRAHVGWDEEAEDDSDYRIDHVYIVAPDGTAYDCRGRFDNEQELVGPDETGGVETQFVDYSLADLKADVARGELRPFSRDDLTNAVKFAQSIESVNENFADGKVKGKSRPGRVKRSGASCSGSVTSLRAKARKYGGERGKMYHWCANMKSGRKKK